MQRALKPDAHERADRDIFLFYGESVHSHFSARKANSRGARLGYGRGGADGRAQRAAQPQYNPVFGGKARLVDKDRHVEGFARQV